MIRSTERTAIAPMLAGPPSAATTRIPYRRLPTVWPVRFDREVIRDRARNQQQQVVGGGHPPVQQQAGASGVTAGVAQPGGGTDPLSMWAYRIAVRWA
jgi:hypothetical protein